jgi:hypothetical protein
VTRRTQRTSAGHARATGKRSARGGGRAEPTTAQAGTLALLDANRGAGGLLVAFLAATLFFAVRAFQAYQRSI